MIIDIISNVFAGGQRLGGWHGADYREGFRDGGRDERGHHAAHAKMRSERVSELVMRLPSLQESPGKRKLIDCAKEKSAFFISLLFFPPRFFSFIGSVMNRGLSNEREPDVSALIAPTAGWRG